MDKKILTVAKVNKYIKNKLEEDFVLQDLYVQGEISNLKNHYSGHIYFTLKDSKASINCVMFKSYATNIKFNLENGMKVTVLGYVSMYEVTGQFQLYCEKIEVVGIGNLTVAFEQLKEKLYLKGYFDESNKKIIPKYPKCVAVITSPTGAAVEDIIRTITRRNNSIKIVVVPTLVQGDGAKASICESIKMVNNWGKCDVIILGRGGGSIEDLWGFNEEVVANCIFKSKIPIISAVGHETDFTISDFVADVRVSTPTAAGEYVSLPKGQIIKEVSDNVKKISYLLNEKITDANIKLNNLMKNKNLTNPEKIIFHKEVYMESLIKKLNINVYHKLEINKSKLEKNVDKLDVLSPLNILKRGYCTVENENGIIQPSIDNINIDDNVTINMDNGYIKAVVVGKGEKNA